MTEDWTSRYEDCRDVDELLCPTCGTPVQAGVTGAELRSRYEEHRGSALDRMQPHNSTACACLFCWNENRQLRSEIDRINKEYPR